MDIEIIKKDIKKVQLVLSVALISLISVLLLLYFILNKNEKVSISFEIFIISFSIIWSFIGQMLTKNMLIKSKKGSSDLILFNLFMLKPLSAIGSIFIAGSAYVLTIKISFLITLFLLFCYIIIIFPSKNNVIKLLKLTLEEQELLLKNKFNNR